MRSLAPPFLLAGCALFAAPLRADTAASIQTLDHCHDTLTLNALNAPGAKPVKGIDGLRSLCPALEHAIEDSGLQYSLPEHWQDGLDAGGIADISALLRRYQSAPLSAAPRVPTLYQIAQSLNPPQRHSWWQDFKDWLRQLLLAPTPSDSSWFARWLSPGSLPQLLLRSIIYVMLAAILAMALWIVWREFKAAELAAGRGRRARQPQPSGPLLPGTGALKLEDLETAPPHQQPALLLRLLVQVLLQSGRLRHERSLTHRELAVRSAFDEPGQHVSFETLSMLAERLLYGPAPPASSAAAPPPIEPALAAGRQLYAQLLGSRATAR